MVLEHLRAQQFSGIALVNEIDFPDRLATLQLVTGQVLD